MNSESYLLNMNSRGNKMCNYEKEKKKKKSVLQDIRWRSRFICLFKWCNLTQPAVTLWLIVGKISRNLEFNIPKCLWTMRKNRIVLLRLYWIQKVCFANQEFSSNTHLLYSFSYICLCITGCGYSVPLEIILTRIS